MTDTRDLDQALLTVFRYGDWKNVTLRMTDDQREAAAAAVQRAGHDSAGVRWWAFTPAAADVRTAERLAAALGCPAPPTPTAEQEREVGAWIDDCDRQVAEFYAHPEKRATQGPLVLPAFPPLPSENGR